MKAAIAERRKAIRESLNASRRDLRKAERANMFVTTARIENEIVRQLELVSFYGPQVHPIEFENGYVINGKLLEQFIKKLPRGTLTTACFTDENVFELHYGNGVFTLYNLSEYYDFIKLPKGEVFLDERGIDFKQPC